MRRPPAHRGADARPPVARRPVDHLRQRGRRVVALIPDARLVPLESRNHILLADEPAWRVFIDEVAAFLEPERQSAGATSPAAPVEALSPREVDVLRLAADGRTNEEIAAPSGSARGPSSGTSRTSTRSSGSAAGRLGPAAVAELPAAPARLTSLRVGRHGTAAASRRLGAGAVSAGVSPPPSVRGRSPDRAANPEDAEPCRPRCSPRPRPGSAPTRPPLDRRPRSRPRSPTAARACRPARSTGTRTCRPPLGGENLAPSPTAYLLGALAGCAVAFLHDTLAPQFDVAIDDVTAVAGCSTDARGLLGHRRRRPGPRGPRLDIRVSSPSPAAAVEAMLAAWRERCPIYLALLKPQGIALTAGVA